MQSGRIRSELQDDADALGSGVLQSEEKDRFGVEPPLCELWEHGGAE